MTGMAQEMGALAAPTDSIGLVLLVIVESDHVEARDLRTGSAGEIGARPLHGALAGSYKEDDTVTWTWTEARNWSACGICNTTVSTTTRARARHFSSSVAGVVVVAWLRSVGHRQPCFS